MPQDATSRAVSAMSLKVANRFWTIPVLHEARSTTMVFRNLLRGKLPIALLIATGATCGPVIGDESPAGLPADLTFRVDGLFAKWDRPDSPGCALGIVHRGQLIYSKGF